ncbi:MAG: hypothetical protein NT162_00140 [Candidatus Woesebacteria bacterium]|nr:hypothetical protein [Candidatus Woesebacteria bacterium]
MTERKVSFPKMSDKERARYRDLDLVRDAYMCKFSPKLKEGEFAYFFGVAWLGIDGTNTTREELEATFSHNGTYKIIFDWDNVPIVDRAHPGEVRFVSGKEYGVLSGRGALDAVAMVHISDINIWAEVKAIIRKT